MKLQVLTQVVDPVCGMTITPEKAAGSYEYKGETFYFCSKSCLAKFQANPETFIQPKPVEHKHSAHEHAAATEKSESSKDVEYTCPMHPQIVQIGPGVCPICGMALEPKIVSLDDAPDAEYLDMKRRFWISAVLTLPIFVLAMAEMLPGFHDLVSPRVSIWIQFLLATPVVLWGGFPFFNGLMREKGVDFSASSQSDELRAEGQTVMFVAVDGKPVGLVGVADSVKDSAKQAIAELHRLKIEVVMMTGDNAKTAEAVAQKLKIDQVFADVLPEQKADKVKELQAAGKTVAMAGDGVNDAPALAQADVGIAMGTGTDVALEAADITLLKGDLRGILRAKNLSRATMQNIRQNLFFAFIYNAVGVPIAAGVLYPVFGLLLSPMIASAAMTFSSVSVILNALRLRKTRI